ncbi:MAG: ankyrin repeat domain-containing protein, partial [Candidatus Wallbacteria bacterium]|nr:ankyrin repeat domain-containing protein [Candidatus Wallbacteria bacterium]
EMLLDKGADIDQKSLFISSCRNGQTDIARLLLSKGVDVNSRSAQNETALMVASAGGFLDTVKFLIESKADLNAGDGDNRTAMMFAATGGYESVMALLQEKGADPKLKDKNGNTAGIILEGFKNSQEEPEETPEEQSGE